MHCLVKYILPKCQPSLPMYGTRLASMWNYRIAPNAWFMFVLHKYFHTSPPMYGTYLSCPNTSMTSHNVKAFDLSRELPLCAK